METRHKNYAIGILFIITVLLSACSSDGSSDGSSGGDSGDNNSGSNDSLPTRSWGTAEMIDAGDSRFPKIAMDTIGNAFVVWNQSNSSRTNIRVRQYTNDNGWETAETIYTTFEYAGLPQIAITATGNAFAVWLQSDIGINNVDNIMANRYTIDNGWDRAELIETQNGYLNNPKITIDSIGNAHAVWSNRGDNTVGYSTLWTNTYKVRNTTSVLAPLGWGTEELFTDSDAAFGQQITTKTNNGIFAAWRQNGNILARRATTTVFSGTTWGTAELIGGGIGGGLDRDPRIANNATGNAIAIWLTDGNIASNYYNGLSWRVPQLLELNANLIGFSDRHGEESAPIGEHQVAMDSTGNAIAVWSQRKENLIHHIWASRYTINNGWNTPELLSSDLTDDAANPQIAIDANNNAIVVWSQPDSAGGSSIWANRYTNGSGWGVAETIEIPIGGVSKFPQIAIDAFGDAIVVWHQDDGLRNNIWANQFK